MSARHPTLSRRRFLRGAGSAVLLPALASLAPRGARAAIETDAKRRHVLFFAPNGAVMNQWTPTDVGNNYTLTPALQPLAAVREHVTVLSGLDLPYLESPSHQVRMRSLLTERLEVNSGVGRYGASLDQHLAPVLSATVPLPSIQFGCESEPACASHECAWLNVASWAGEGQPMPVWRNPVSMFDRLFAGVGPVDAYARAAYRRRARSVLDTVLDDLDRVKTELSSADHQQLDRYLTGLREVERRLDLSGSPSEGCPPSPPNGIPTESPERVEVSMELVRLALECDVTRVVAFMVGGAESYRTLGFLGQEWDHHGSSHFFPPTHAAATTWQVSCYADFVEKLRDTVQPSGRTLLDDTFALYTSEISSGPDHGGTSVPTLLAGGGGVGFRGGRHVALPAGTPMANLAVSFLESHGLDGSSFGVDATGSAIDLG